jgi:hypothetical protein
MANTQPHPNTQVRNLCLGLAARGVDWAAQGGRGSLEIMGRLVVRLFGNLFTRSEKISQVRQQESERSWAWRGASGAAAACAVACCGSA